MFTKRHYEALAKSLRKSYPIHTDYLSTQDFYAAVDRWHATAATLAADLYDDSDRFDPQRFLEAATP